MCLSRLVPAPCVGDGPGTNGAVIGGLPGGLGYAGELSGVRHLAQTNSAQAELAVHRVRTTALIAPGVAAHLELRLATLLVDQGGLCHLLLVLLEREAKLLEQGPTRIVGRCGGHHGDIHPSRAVNSIDVNLVEHGLLVETEGVIAITVKLSI